MIIVKLQGGLGNQMFQYAVGRVLSCRNKVPLKFDSKMLNKIGPTGVYRALDIDVFNIHAVKCNNQERRKFVPSLCLKIFSKVFKRNFLNQKYYKENNINFDENVLNLGDNCYLDGFWQSWKYFDGYSDIIKKDFSLKEEYLNKLNVKFLNQIENSHSVAIHIRRGDYLSNREVNKIHGVCDKEYYLNSIKYIKSKIENPIFFIFSDDPEWCRKEFDNSYNIVFGNTGWQDLYLMSKCKNQIIANSSFSWWAAYLNNYKDKIVITPKTWFAGLKVNMKDRILNNWLNI